MRPGVGDALRRMDIRPNHTIYINNINDKIKKEGTAVLGGRCGGKVHGKDRC